MCSYLVSPIRASHAGQPGGSDSSRNLPEKITTRESQDTLTLSSFFAHTVLYDTVSNLVISQPPRDGYETLYSTL